MACKSVMDSDVITALLLLLLQLQLLVLLVQILVSDLRTQGVLSTSQSASDVTVPGHRPHGGRLCFR